MSLDFESLTSSAVIRPGDKLVVGLADDGQTDEDVQRVRAEIKEELPGVDALVIVGATSLATYRPDGFADMETKSVAELLAERDA